MTKFNLLGIGVDPLCLEDLLERIQQAILAQNRLLIMHANIRAVNLAQKQAEFRQSLNAADVVFCDGMGLKLGARLLGYHLPQRFTLADWVWNLIQLAVDNHFSLFLLGGANCTAEKAASTLKSRFPQLNVVGFHHGFFNKSKTHPENIALINLLNGTQADILLVGFGMPTQEQWLFENWAQLKTKVAITCGALFEYLTGDLKRGPQWMTENYLEWLARVIYSPRRYLLRYLIDGVLFFAYLLQYQILHQGSRLSQRTRMKE